MKQLLYGVAVSALVIGTGGLALACEQHAKSAALQNPAAAAQAAANEPGFVLAQMQQDEKSGTTGEESKEAKPEGEDQK